MKKMIFSAFFVGLVISTLHAQEVKMNAIPYVMNFQNSVIDYKITGDNSLVINAQGHTGLFHQMADM